MQNPVRASLLFGNWLASKSALRALVPDRIAIAVLYALRIGQWPRLTHPETFNEKIQWMKLHLRDPVYTTLADKYAVREYVADAIGAEHLIPLLGRWQSFDEIDFDALPDAFVLKCNHDSQHVVLCPEKAKLDKAAARALLTDALAHNWYWNGRQWAYKNIKPCIIAEQYLTQADGSGAVDYKVLCFGGEPELIALEKIEAGARHISYFNTAWQPLPLERTDYKNIVTLPEPPQNLPELLGCARSLAQNKPFARVDLYSANETVYFGEITLYQGNGLGQFVQKEWDDILGKKLVLPCDGIT